MIKAPANPKRQWHASSNAFHLTCAILRRIHDDTLQAAAAMTIPITDLARAYNALHPETTNPWPFPPTTSSVRRINEALSIQLPASLLQFALESSACHHWLASFGEDYDAHHHVLRVTSRTRRIRRRIPGGGGWEFVKPASFIPINRGHDHDYDCLDADAFDPSTKEYAIQYWTPPRIIGTCRFSTFADYITSHMKAWAQHSRRPGALIARAILADA